MFTPRSFGKVGVEAYAAYALRAWLARDCSIGDRTRGFAKWSAIGSFALGMAGQVAYHLLAQAGMARAPWAITTIVSCLPSWSWPWGPRWRTCCAPMPTPRLTIRRTAGPGHQPSCGPCPGPRRTRTDQTADDRRLTGTGPRGGTRMLPSRDHDTAMGSRDLVRGPPDRRWIRLA